MNPVIGFNAQLLRELSASDPDRLSMVRMEGDSMAPTFGDGDELLVDRGDGTDRLRDGIYVLRIDDALIVKRISRSANHVAIRSDNQAYPAWPVCEPAALAIIGRVVWAGRRVP